MVSKSTKINNIAILANATELAAELAFDVLKGGKNQRGVGDDTTRLSREELQRIFAIKLGSKLLGKGGVA